MSKRYSVFLCVLFCVFIGAFAALHLFLPDRTFSENENRNLEQLPIPQFTGSGANFFSGEFMRDFETYVTDQFPLRDAFMSVKAACELALGKTENNNVFFGEDDTLFAGVDFPKEGLVDKNLSFVEKLAQNLDIPVYFSLVPNKLNIEGDRLLDPPAALWGNELPLALSVNYLGEDLWSAAAQLQLARWVDLMPTFRQHADEGLFYRTDHHWTSLGAYYGYAALMEAMGMEAVALENYEKTTVSTDFLGTTYSSSGAGWVKPDSIDIYVPEDGVSVITYSSGAAAPGQLYDESRLEVKDKYSYFMGGNTPLAVISTGHTEGQKVLVIRDSYSDSLAPFLTAHFSEIHLFDLRYNNSSITQYVEENGIDTVIVLYSLSNFLTDNNLFKMAR